MVKETFNFLKFWLILVNVLLSENIHIFLADGKFQPFKIAIFYSPRKEVLIVLREWKELCILEFGF